MSTKERQKTAAQSDSSPPTSVIVWKSVKKARWGENTSTKERQQTAGQSDSSPPTSVIVWKSEKARWVFAEF
ncbi:hypothetical protein CEXT_322331 [Caerostris extrusa]|uniref:Uncharacterized protein n=1 Tax=Caerostris extrusa TaxID=172846 RepID=A0AAV4Q2F2_CAEEX|nr:hypothetical protein CEXT_322331 [Caerostris extrusa]